MYILVYCPCSNIKWQLGNLNMLMDMWSEASCHVTLCSLLDCYRYFRRICWLDLQGRSAPEDWDSHPLKWQYNLPYQTVIFQDGNLKHLKPIITLASFCTATCSNVKALCYKLEGCGFDSLWSHGIFSIYLILLATSWPWGWLSL
jgi:hypothetical protein